MAQIRLSKEEKEQIVSTNHHAPRSVLGFHEVERSNKTKAWIVRVLEPDAEQVLLYWDDQSENDAVELKRIHAGGLFELVMDPRPTLMPYKLKISYTNGNQHEKYDPYYFAPQLTEFDFHLFAEGNHHKIYYKLGAHLTTQDGVAGTLFAVWSPNARRVSVVGDFNHWDGRKHAMENRGSSGIWELFVPGVQEGAIYKYEIQSQQGGLFLKADPYGFAMEHRPATGSVVANLNGFEWHDQAWMEEREKKNLFESPISIYEVHLGSWKRIPEQDNRFISYQEAVDQLIPYVKEMGYTHIELMGLAEHPFDGSWGYQVVGYYAVTSRFGSPKEFMHFVDRCHQEGIGIIMDWVPAHFPKDAHGLGYFDGSHLYEHADPRKGEHSDWGTKIFNYGRNEVRNFLVSNALFWLEYYHLDGVRVDAVASMLYLDYSRNPGEWVPNEYGGNENLDAIFFIKNFNEVIFNYYPGIISVAEESTAWPGVSHPTYTGGLGFNFKWNMGWMNDTLRYIGNDPIYRSYDNHLITFSMVYAYSEKYILPISHDEVVHGKGNLLGKMPGDYWQQRANYRLYLSFMTAHPGKKLLFMGCEFGQWQEWSEASSLDWNLVESNPDHWQLQQYCKNLNFFYRNHPALYTTDLDQEGFEWIDFHDHANSVYSFLRKPKTSSDEPPILFVFNFTPVPRQGYRIGTSIFAKYAKVLDSDASEFGGSGYNQQTEIQAESNPWHGRPYSLNFDLPPLAAVALQPIA